VLTFPVDSDARGRVTAGEVVVCIPEARRQAKARRIPPRLEVLLYALHGMLHLIGYDDSTRRGYQAMHRIEDELMMQLGLRKVFARDPVRTPRGAK
jgi:probable rRNA maturation factor